MKNENFKKLKNVRLLTVLLTIFLVACTPSEEAKDAVEDSLKIPSAGVPPLPTLDVNCYHDRYATPEESITRKIDILIVPDTSASIIEERGAIADGFDSFLSIMPAAADIRVGVMLAHGGTASRSGKLYKKGTEPLILDNQLLTMAEIKAHLRTKMQNPAEDSASDGGEMGLYSLNKSLIQSNFETIQGQGFYRDDAALVVIFVADEQDICAQYPQGISPVVDPQGGETNSYNNFCIDGSGNTVVSAKIVVDRLKELYMDKPLVVGGVVYNNLNTVPFGGENELGYGYLEAIELAGGISVDMATGDYGNGLSKLGTLAMTKLAPVNSFNLSITNVDPSTIKTYVNEVSVPFTYSSELNIASLVNDRPTFSVADVQYCEKPQVLKEVIQVSNGGFHTCGLLATGDVKCFGQNQYGQLGYGHTNNLGDNETIESIGYVPLGEKAIQLVSGLYHTCALLESKKVRCWGYNDLGQLGLGNTENIGDNEQVTDVGYVNLGTTEVKRLYSGTSFNCALFIDGKIKCWGSNEFGQLGTGNANIGINIGDDEEAAAGAFVNLSGAALQMDLSTISFHACAIMSGGVLKCWGKNAEGQLGIGSTINQGAPTTSVTLPKPAIMVTTGNSHTCALLSDYSINCFGDNGQSQLGLGIATSLNIGDDETPSVSSNVNVGFTVEQVVAGNYTTCALSFEGEAKCWGRNSKGQLGQGNTTAFGSSNTPNNLAPIKLGAAVSSMAAGSEHHCFLHNDSGKLKCIGSSVYGQLGYGNTNNIGDNETPENLGFISLLDI